MKMKRFLILLLVALMLFSLTACQASSTDSEADTSSSTDDVASESESESSDSTVEFDGEITIGFFDSLTGTSAILGKGSLNGAKLAVKQINAAGGVDGKELVLISYDDKASPEEAVKIVNRLLEVDDVDIILGSEHSGNIQAYGAIVEEAQMPSFGMGTSPVWLQQGWTYLFRAAINNSYSAIALVDAYKEMGITTTCIFHSQTEYGKSCKDTFVDLCEQNGIEVLGIESMNSGDSDFTAQCSSIAALNPEAVYVAAASTDVAPMVNQLRSNGYDSYLFGEQLGIPEVRKVTNENSDLSVYATCYKMPSTSPEEATTEIQQQFFQDYLDEYGEMAETEVAGKAYDAIYLMAMAIELAGGSLDGTDIRDAVWSIDGYEGVQGVYDYTGQDGEGIHSTPTYIIVDGEDILFSDYVASLE